MKKKILALGLAYVGFVAAMLCAYYASWGRWIPLIVSYTVIVLIPPIVYLKCCRSGRILMKKLRGLAFSVKSKHYGKNLLLSENITINNPKCITFGDNCSVDNGAAFFPLSNSGGKRYPAKIIMGNNVHIGSYSRFASMNCVEIEDDVLLAAFVHITDHSHEFRDISLPVHLQGVFTKGSVRIGKGSWLGYGCNILAGVTLGEHCVVAAGAIVTKSVPPYSVVAGCPAKVIKRYDFEKEAWVSAE
ncbi:MAG TPA: hypothetical protein DDW65_25555 [Firmicutes bacterium]|nr:hypothetical protein [Bacillota bacterium]